MNKAAGKSAGQVLQTKKHGGKRLLDSARSSLFGGTNGKYGNTDRSVGNAQILELS